MDVWCNAHLHSIKLAYFEFEATPVTKLKVSETECLDVGSTRYSPLQINSNWLFNRLDIALCRSIQIGYLIDSIEPFADQFKLVN